MKKWDRIVALCLAFILVLAGCGDGAGGGTNAVYVDSVGKLAGVNGFAGVQNRFAGMVEPQATLKVNPEQGRTVKTTLVEEGQSVQEGDPLFVYDTEDIRLSLEQAQLEMERLDNSISTYYTEITALEEEKETPPKKTNCSIRSRSRIGWLRLSRENTTRKSSSRRSIS